MSMKVMNIVNFVRVSFVNAQTAKNFPEKKKDIYETVEKQIKLNKECRIPSTFLLQYDAIHKSPYRELFLRERDESIEIGIWFEISRSIVEKVGLKWRGSEEHDYEWHSDIGYLEGYSTEEREMLVDEAFRMFFEVFGEYPRVVGGWLLDAHSINYMKEKYDILACCVCREQHSVDAYTLWGGYYSGGYYPSKRNMLCPASTRENQIDVPVFRMLGVDPMYCYDGAKYNKNISRGPLTLEPFSAHGKNEKIVDWFFKEYYTNPCLSHSQATTGQENPFEWAVFGEGYTMQVKKLVDLWKKGIVSLEKLGDTGKRYKSAFSMTPPSALMALTDWAENGHKTVWYSSKNYRANLFLTDDKLLFRDITKFDEGYSDRYHNRRCETWMAIYDNLPIIDSKLWSSEDVECGLFFEKSVSDFSVSEKEDCSLEITVYFEDGTSGKIHFDENGIFIEGCGDMKYITASLDANTDMTFDGQTFLFVHNGYEYKMPTVAKIQKDTQEYVLCPVGNVIEFKMH